MIRFLFKQRRPRQFSIKPRYYDQTKEYIEQRKAQIERQGESNLSHGRLGRQWRSAQKRSANARSNKTILVILTILLAIAYYLFYK